MNEQYASRPFNIPKINDRAYGASLSKEVNTLQAEVVYQSFNEQRNYPRFKPDTKIFVLHSTQGTVEKISMGGLSYTYYQLPKESSKPLPKAITIFSAEKRHLIDIPCTVIADTVIRKAYSFFPELKQRCIQFTGLNEKQLQCLEQFILTHANVGAFDLEENTHTPALAKFDYAV